MELMPRITRAQSMDILSSQSNLAGYKAVVDAASGVACPLGDRDLGAFRTLPVLARLRGLPARLVPCDDLKSPGDVDFADELEGWPPRKEE